MPKTKQPDLGKQDVEWLEEIYVTLTRDELSTIAYLCTLAPDVPEAVALEETIANIIWAVNNNQLI